MSRKHGNESGSILIASLWTIAILAVLAVGLSYRARVGLKLTAYAWDEIRLAQIAKTGAVVAGAVLKQSATGYGALNQAWNNNPDFRQYQVPEGWFSLFHDAEGNSEQVQYGLADEAGKINVNQASLAVLERVFSLNPEIASAVVDWRDGDDTPLPRGAEKASYVNAGLPYTCRNAPFQSLDELLLVKGMTPEIYSQIKDLITIYSPGRVNVNTAPSEVLQALGLPATLADKILFFRRGNDGTESTADDGVFKDVSSIVSTLQHAVSLKQEEVAALNKALSDGLLTVQAGAFRLNLLAHLKDHPVERRFELVISGWDRQPGRILYWHEGL